MRHSILTVGVFALVLTGAIAAQDHGEHWVADFDKAVEIAKKDSKDLLVDFTGSDWCGWCIRLNKEVFDHEEFLTEATKHFVLVSLDFPQGEEAKSKVPNPKRNEELQEKYGIRGFPTILLMDAGGEVYGRTGYRPGGPAPYLEHLKELKQASTEVTELVKEFESAEGEAKTAAWTKAVAALAKMEADNPKAAALAKIVKAELPNAKDQAKVDALLALLKSGQAEEAERQMVTELDPKNEKGLREQAVAAATSNIQSLDELKVAVESIEGVIALGPIKDSNLEKIFRANLAFWYHKHLNDAAKAKIHAEHLKSIAGDDERFTGLIEMILGG